MLPNLKVVTLNLLNDLTDWPLRAPLIVDELNTLQPDLIALQKWCCPTTRRSGSPISWGYSLHLTPKTGGPVAAKVGDLEPAASRTPAGFLSSIRAVSLNA